MQRIYIFSGLVLLLAACAHTHPMASANIHFHGDTATDANGKLLLLGQHPRTDLEQAPFASWFDTDYASYTVDSTVVSRLRPLLEDHTFEIFMGTWCGDSRREVPRMFKILDACHVPADHIRLIMVDYRGHMYKQSPRHEEQGRYIVHVPDLLILDGAMNSEQGRIVESPVVSLEKDLLSIAEGAPYEPQYPAAYWLSAQLKRSPEDWSDEKLAITVDSLRTKTTSESELYTLSYVLLQQRDTTHAVLVSRLNTAVFPRSALAYIYMGHICAGMSDTDGARKAYEHALELDPKTKQAKDWLDAHPRS